MKQMTKKVLFIIGLCFTFSFFTETSNVYAASIYSKTTVTNKKSSKTIKKNFRTKKKAKKTRTKKYTSKKEQKRTLTSVPKKVITTKSITTIITKKYKKKSKKYSYKKVIITNIRTETISYIRPGIASINQLNGLIDSRLLSTWRNSGYLLETNSSSALLHGCDGVFSPSNKKIVLKNNVDEVFIHELGHFLSHKTKDADDSNEWINIFNEEKGNYTFMNADYAKKTNVEFFAECFKQYSLNYAEFRKKCPKASKFIEKILHQL